jgi:hypothetical protein
MGHPDNYFQHSPTPAEIKQRIKAVIESASMIRKEINRIRNTSTAMQMDLPRPLMHALLHLRLSTINAAVEYCYMMGYQGEEFQDIQKALLDPHAMNDNEPT